MNDQPTWHVPGDLLARYLSDDLPPARLIAVETHLATCGPCRTAVPYDPVWLAENRAAIADIVDRPRLTLLERVLTRAGVPEHLTRILAATPTLSRSWLLAVVLVLAFAVAAARLWPGHTESLLPFLIVAPVLPLGGIALAYGKRVDPAHELLAATPVAGPRLLLVRACAVLAAAIALAGAATPLIPAMTAAWLLPALSLAAGCLALSTRLPVQTAAAAAAGVWLGVIFMLGGLNGDLFIAFRPTAQILYGATIPIFALIMYARSHRPHPGDPR